MWNISFSLSVISGKQGHGALGAAGSRTGVCGLGAKARLGTPLSGPASQPQAGVLPRAVWTLRTPYWTHGSMLKCWGREHRNRPWWTGQKDGHAAAWNGGREDRGRCARTCSPWLGFSSGCGCLESLMEPIRPKISWLDVPCREARSSVLFDGSECGWVRGVVHQAAPPHRPWALLAFPPLS